RPRAHLVDHLDVPLGHLTQRVEQPLAVVPEDVEQAVLLRREERVEGAARHPRAGDDLLYRGVRVAARGKDRPRGVTQPGMLILAPLLRGAAAISSLPLVASHNHARCCTSAYWFSSSAYGDLYQRVDHPG